MAMAEYKDAKQIKAKLQNICDRCWHPYRLGGCPEHCGINEANKAVDSVPPVDAIPVSWIKEQAKKRDKAVASILMLTVQEWKDETD